MDTVRSLAGNIVSTSEMREASQVRGREDIALSIKEYIDKRLEELEPVLTKAESGESEMPLNRDELEFLTGSVAELHLWRQEIVERRVKLQSRLDRLEGKS